LLKITAIHETIARFAARVLRILKMTIVARAWTKEVAMAKVIEFYIPQKNSRASPTDKKVGLGCGWKTAISLTDAGAVENREGGFDWRCANDVPTGGSR
jgi:hypothetical protein